MKKLLERLKLNNDRTKLFVGLGATLLVLIAAMLLPLAFRTAPGGTDAPAPMTLEGRALMFARYWTPGDAESGFTVEKPDPVPKKLRDTCETVMRTLIARSIDDQGLEDFTPTGTEYTYISDADGREIHVCRMWLERRGDWQNWLDVCIDADTGALYYYYLSRECLTNRKNYARPEQTDASQIAELLATENGWTLRYLSDEPDGGAAAVYSTPGGTLCYAISCRVYDALVDIRLSCR